MFIPYFSVVRTKQVAIIEAFGRFDKIVPAGPCLVLPWQKVAAKLSLKVQEMQVGVETKTSDDVFVKGNNIHGNVAGVGLFHPNAAGNATLPEMNNWVIEQNHIHNNNLFPNPAPPESFQALVPSGSGVLLLGVSDNVVSKNLVENNALVGIGVLGWCTALPFDCVPLPDDPTQASNNLISQNTLNNNGFVNGLDIVQLLSNMGPCPGPEPVGDFGAGLDASSKAEPASSL